MCAERVGKREYKKLVNDEYNALINGTLPQVSIGTVECQRPKGFERGRRDNVQ